MDAAVLEWVEGATPEDIATGKKISESKFAKAKSYPPSTFYKHAASYKESRTPLRSVPDRAAAANELPNQDQQCLALHPRGGAPRKRKLTIPSRPLTATEGLTTPTPKRIALTALP